VPHLSHIHLLVARFYVDDRADGFRCAASAARERLIATLSVKTKDGWLNTTDEARRVRKLDLRCKLADSS
jgi:hypothetical protein